MTYINNSLSNVHLVLRNTAWHQNNRIDFGENRTMKQKIVFTSGRFFYFSLPKVPQVSPFFTSNASGANFPGGGGEQILTSIGMFVY